MIRLWPDMKGAVSACGAGNCPMVCQSHSIEGLPATPDRRLRAAGKLLKKLGKI